MAEFASKGVAGAGLGLGIAGTALGLLNNGGLNLGGILGGNTAGGVALGVMAEKDAKIAELTAEKYADGVGKEVYAQSRNENAALRTEMYAYIKPLADEAANNRVQVARLEEQMHCMEKTRSLEKQLLESQINCVASNAAQGIAALQAVVGKITNTIVPASAICPAPMPQYNSWTAPTTPTTTTTTPAA